MSSLLQDIRYAIRTLAKSRGFAAVAVLTLALGIGANTAIFSVVNTTMLAPLPFNDPSTLVNIHAHATFFDFWNLGLSLPDIIDVRSQSKSFSAVVPFQYSNVDLTGRGTPRQLDGATVTSDFFSMLGIKPLYGRAFLPAEMQPGADREAILSGALWRTQFGSDPHIVGTSIMLDGKPYQVVGVMPPLPKIMFSPAMVDIWTPFAPSQEELSQRGNHGIPVMARLKPGVSIAQAQAELDGIAARLAKAYPKEDKEWSFRADSLRQDMTRDSRTPLFILLGAVGFVLLIACANVGNLFLSRGWARRRELAIRSTLGATRARLVRQLIVESLMLALAGGACGLLLAEWSVVALKPLVGVMMFGGDRVTIDTRVLLFTLGVSILAGLLFGLAPAFLSSRNNLTIAMKESAAGAQTGASSSGHNPLRQILVVTEIALALVLVIGATLALRSLSRLLRVNLGFDTRNVLAIELDMPAAKFKTEQDLFSYVRTLTDRFRSNSAVESACATTNGGPLSGSHGEAEFAIEGAAENPSAKLTADWASAAPGYFHTMGIPLLQGREFTEADQLNSARAVIVNESLAQKFFGAQSPIGKRIWMGDEDAKHNRIWNEIVGVAGNARDWNPRAAPRPEIYASFFQSDFSDALKSGFQIDLFLRTKANPAAVISAAQREIWSFDKDQPISSVETMQHRVATSVASPRFQSFLLAAFGALGLLLAMVGIYGVISYSVTQRTHEIGIRMALGAEPRQVLRLVLAQGLRLAAIGVAVGIVASLFLTRLMSSLLFGVSATDAVTFIGVALLLVVVALLACYIPARRAMRVDPMVALRYE
ncbi:MAG TPA: ABC transporter permease [Candidatus Acidoferrales bacterium]|nr:ABC transporter permease [Candidatus Acidoferrales bacterium]